MHAAAASDVGRVRSGNEDAFICDAERGIFAVIDGVGGHAGGEVAAAIARRELELRLRRETGTVEDRLREAIAAANASILEEAARTPALSRMACVLTAAVVTPHHVVAGHVGDTRLYKVGPRGMRKLTHDHSPVGLLEDSGQVTEEDAMRHPDRNQVFREVGTAPRQPTDHDFIEIVTEDVGPDDALLLCSDGLTDLVPAAEIERIVRRHGSDPPRAVGELVRAANAAGGKDNVTAIVAAGAAFGRAAGAADAAERPAAAGGASAEHSPAPRSWPWAAVTVLGFLGFLAFAWWWSGGMGALEPGRLSIGGAPRVLRVSPAPGADFTSIRAAIDAARPGDTVAVAPGVYAESLELREGVILQSDMRRGATLRRPGGFDGAWTAISARGVRDGLVSGFVIEGSDASPLQYGVYVTDGRVEIDDMEISGAQGAAVQMSGSATALLRSSHIHDNPGAAVVVESRSTPEILHNVMERNGRGTPPRAAIDIRPGARAAIAGNIIRGSAVGVAGLSAADHARVLRDNAVQTVDSGAREGES
jgi:serine/threonine protein phosphatase PrpC